MGNPLTAGLAQNLIPQPCTLVIFGGAGDLSARKLLPALYNLSLDGVLPTNFAVVGFARNELDDSAFRAFARDGIERFSRRPLDEAHWADYSRSLFYVTGSFTDAQAYVELKRRLEKIDSEFGIPGNRVFYLSIPPSLIATCVEQLKANGFVADPGEGPISRVIVEKPIGRDLATARAINATLARTFDESQTFRIDHYLGKETVQNILVLRFANSVLEPLWNAKYVDHVQLTVAEEEGVGLRAGYYEEAGALRDMVQNHILQVLAMIAMEPPWSLDPENVRDAKLNVLRCLRPLTAGDIDKQVVRAQYGPGYHHGEEVPGYRREEGVRRDSTTETYVALKVFIDNWRWAGVPFYIRTGKRMPKRVSEAAIYFKPVPEILFNTNRDAPLEPNVLTLRIQPDEGFSLRLSSKLPGPKVRIYPVKMDFHYGATFGDSSPEAYERLLLDVMAGDATLFMRRDAVEAAWAWMMGVLDAWESSRTRYLPEYPTGDWSPVEADRLIEADGRKWRTL
ncbi:MAG: glucose-6-phosphate dehydrogenase [Candidatus Rokubacteria bacterium 13_1_40CM_4_69_5]|nr:MAG: glucose-6-phosphate dehydrogenase [Candidatus Rokubacteria bacterium 13_1_40CM_4_69_5]OLE37585.1 MAG: glucose-6-phosphate dehydrogenase [Candidatus Rokubacteria bacterium 13_1_20CM_2_70_7]